MTPTKTEPLEAQMQSTTSVDLRAMAGAPKGTSGVRTVPLGMLHQLTALLLFGLMLAALHNTRQKHDTETC